MGMGLRIQAHRATSAHQPISIMKITNAPRLIGLTGANGAGKDTVASMLAGLIRSSDQKTAVLAFADALYEEVAQAFGVTVERLKHRTTKETPSFEFRLVECKDEAFRNRFEMELWREHRSPRQILQWWGTEYRRAQQPDYWVQRLQDKAAEMAAAGITHIIVSDVRFADEAAAIRTMGGQIWRVHRPSLQATGTGHVSEVTGEEFAPEVTITNQGSFDHLRLTLLQTLLRNTQKHKEHAWQS